MTFVSMIVPFTVMTDGIEQRKTRGVVVVVVVVAGVTNVTVARAPLLVTDTSLVNTTVIEAPDAVTGEGKEFPLALSRMGLETVGPS